MENIAEHIALPRHRTRLEDESSTVTSSCSSLSSFRVCVRFVGCQRDFSAISISPRSSPRVCFWRYFRRVVLMVRLPICSTDHRGVSFQPETRQSCNIIPIAGDSGISTRISCADMDTLLRSSKDSKLTIDKRMMDLH